jgi:thiol-disulfide isomerase/thioredoxin
VTTSLSTRARIIAALAALAVVAIVLWRTGSFGGSAEEPAALNLDPPRVLTTAGESDATRGLREGDLTPDFEFSAFDGSLQKLSDYRGKVVLVNFWATWCIPCRAEMPDIQTLLSEKQSQGLVVLSINSGEPYARAQSWLDEIGVHLTAVAYDPRSVLYQRYGLLGLPTSFFVNADGAITRINPGPMSLTVMRLAADEALGR